MFDVDLYPLWVTFKLACVTTFFLFFISLPIAYWLTYSKSKLKVVVETCVSLPLVLPPTVIGFYFLITFGANSFLGNLLLQTFNIQLVFSFTGLVFGSIIYSLPFMVHPIQAGLSSLPLAYIEKNKLLGNSKLSTLIQVLLPNIKPSILTALVLSFTHTVGEFGVVLMIGGNIPNQTQVISTSIYNEVESLNYKAANQYAGILLVLSVLVLLLIYTWNTNFFKLKK